MRHKIRGGSIDPLNLAPKTLMEEVTQNIAIILVTPQGTVPLYREFGITPNIIDRPMPAVEPLLIEDIIDKVERFEPRANVTEVTFERDPAHPGKLIPVVEVEIVDE